jgi:DNA-binding response OmpR family regulator
VLSSKILIVDDQPANVQLMQLLLRRAGYLCVTSTVDPRAVCGLHLANKYDLILLDLLMPDFDGFQVMERLNKVEPYSFLSVLVITAQPNHELRAMQAGAKDFISKPFNHSDVLARIRYVLEVRQLKYEAQTEKSRQEVAGQKRTGEQRRSKEVLRELAAHIRRALWIRDPEKKMLQTVNPSRHKLTVPDAFLTPRPNTAYPVRGLGVERRAIKPRF